MEKNKPITTRTSKETRIKFKSAAEERCLTASNVLRIFVNKFITNTDETMEFLLKKTN